MSNNYDHHRLLDVCHNLTDSILIDENPMDYFDWEKLQVAATQSIKSELNSFISDNQKIRFLKNLVDSIFTEDVINSISLSFHCKEDPELFALNLERINEYNSEFDGLGVSLDFLKAQASPRQQYFYNKDIQLYIDKLAECIKYMCYHVSDECMYHDNLQFDQLLFTKTQLYDLDRFLVYYKSNHTLKEVGEQNSFSEEMLLAANEQRKKTENLLCAGGGVNIKYPVQYTLRDIFHNQYKDHYMSFFDELKKDKFGIITLDNTWRNATRAFQYYELLQSSEFNVIRETLPDGTLIKSPMVAAFFENIFKVKPSNFRKSRTVLKADDESLLKEAIKAVINRIQ